MAHLTFDPSSFELGLKVNELYDEILDALTVDLFTLGVAANDIIVKTLRCTTDLCNVGHVEVILKTDNPNVTSDEIVRILSPLFGDIPFEVSRIFVGVPGNWAANY
ncbi:hypothetical protein C4561_00755 [candidate division WWE3 bacterium]|jgi:recombinational DNA repair protein RecR|uniref:Uncharacterized protein n=1 Tax=candidate division WWE3 bacterium TaxID=2053526 RepID=A0A3A4ZMS7_UNCKA|nr:MAG: hypothetical protein C4561_00755 [candidate division WWE3 bacterium]